MCNNREVHMSKFANLYLQSSITGTDLLPTSIAKSDLDLTQPNNLKPATQPLPISIRKY